MEKPQRFVAYKPTTEHRTIVMLCAGMGFTNKQTAEQVGISETTLKKYYAEELATGADKVAMRIAGNVFRIATQQQDAKSALAAADLWFRRIRPVTVREEEAAFADGQPKFRLIIGDRPASAR